MSENDELIKADFRIYRKIEPDAGGRLRGDKSSAESRNHGFVYIYRALRPFESNDDGTRSRLYEIVNLENRQYGSLMEVMRNHKTHYFFAYSQFELSDQRVALLQKELHKCLMERKQPPERQIEGWDRRRASRLAYVPIGEEEDAVDDRLFFSPLFQDEDYEFPSGDNPGCNVRIYLYDWIGYLEDLKDEYLNCYDAYLNMLEQPFDIKTYYTETTQRLVQMGEYFIYDYETLKGEVYPIRLLYPYTKAVQRMASRRFKYRHNLRFHKAYEANGESGSITDGYGYVERYDHHQCVKDLEALIAPHKVRCEEAAEKIVRLFSEDYRRIHTALNDYVFGTDAQKEYAEVLVGSSLKNITLFLNDRAGRLFEDRIAKRTMLEIPRTLKERGGSYPDLEPEALLEAAGDGDYFTFSLAYGIGSPIIAESVYILDSFIQNIPHVTREEVFEIYEYIQDGRYRDLGLPEGRVVSTDKERLKQAWRNMGRDTKNFVYEDAILEWQDGMINRYPHETIDIDFVGPKGDETYFVQRRVLETRTEEIVPHIKTGITNAMEVARMMGHVMDGANIFFQASCFLEMDHEREDAAIAAFSVLGSLTGLFGDTMQASLAAKLSVRTGDALAARMIAEKVVGATGMLFMALESGVRAVKHARARDTDAAFAFALSAAAAMLYVIPGVNVPLWLCLGLSASFALMGGYFADDEVDVFLKYSLWGRHYGEMPDPVPFWWPEVQFSEEEDLIILGDYEPQAPVRFNRNLDAQVQAINRLNSIPDYSFRLGREPKLLENYQIASTLTWEIEGVADMAEIASVDLTLFQGPRLLHRGSLSPSEDPNFFMNGRSYVIPSESEEDENESSADTLRVLYIASRNKLATEIKKALGGQVSFFNINSNPYLEEVPSHFQRNMIPLGRGTDFDRPFRLECVIRYSHPYRSSVKIIKEFG